jgi:hypothetical protein
MGEMRNACSVLARKPEGREPLGRHRCRWENIRMDLRELNWECMNWIDLDQDRDQWQALIMNIVMNLQVP